MARHFRGTRRRAALHRVHGRRRHQRLAHGRGAAVGRGAATHRAPTFPLEPLRARAPGETAERWRYADGGGEIGVISQRDAGLLPRLQPRPAVDRRQAVPVPVREPRPRPARAAARRRQRRPRSPRPSATSGGARRPLLRAAQPRPPAPAAASAASRCTTSAAERPAPHDDRSRSACSRPPTWPTYKRLRDEMLALHPEAFTSDAAERASKGADRLPAPARPRPARARPVRARRLARRAPARGDRLRARGAQERSATSATSSA